MPRYRLRRMVNGALHANRCRCEPIERFRCAGCDRMMGNCLGADTTYTIDTKTVDRRPGSAPELCVDCWEGTDGRHMHLVVS